MRSSNAVCLNIISTMLQQSASLPRTIIDELNKAYGGQRGYVFVVHHGENEELLCLHSTDPNFYTVGNIYKIQDLTDLDNQMLVFDRTRMIGVVIFENFAVFEDDESEKSLVYKTIALALSQVTRGSGSSHFFELEVYAELTKVMWDTIDGLGSMALHVQATVSAVNAHNKRIDGWMKQTRKRLEDAVDLLYDAQYYIKAERNQLQINITSVDIVATIRMALKRANLLESVSVQVGGAPPDPPLNGGDGGVGIGGVIGGGSGNQGGSGGGGVPLVMTDQSKVSQILAGIIRRTRDIALIQVAAPQDGTGSVRIVFTVRESMAQILDEEPKGVRDLSIQLARTLCRCLKGDLRKAGQELIMTLGGLSAP